MGQIEPRIAPAKAGALGKTADRPMLRQYAALCWREVKGEVEVLLITSRDTGRWVIPKGWPMKGLGASDAAAREAWEEAGVRGAVSAECIGLYVYDKTRGAGSVPVTVEVYPLAVSRLDAAGYPEHGQRERKWFAPKKAARRVAEPELADILASFDPGGQRA